MDLFRAACGPWRKLSLMWCLSHPCVDNGRRVIAFVPNFLTLLLLARILSTVHTRNGYFAGSFRCLYVSRI